MGPPASAPRGSRVSLTSLRLLPGVLPVGLLQPPTCVLSPETSEDAVPLPSFSLWSESKHSLDLSFYQ